MNRLFFTVAALGILALPSVARAEGKTMGGLGFHAGSSPFDGYGDLAGHDFATPGFGARQWFGDRIGADVGVGFFAAKTKPSGNKVSGFMASVGVPIVLKRLDDRVNFIVRPGVMWGTQKEDIGPPPIFSTKWTAFAVTGELEAEWMITEHLGVSASHGIAWGELKDDLKPQTTITSSGTLSNNFTQLGFTAYLW